MDNLKYFHCMISLSLSPARNYITAVRPVRGQSELCRAFSNCSYESLCLTDLHCRPTPQLNTYLVTTSEDWWFPQRGWRIRSGIFIWSSDLRICPKIFQNNPTQIVPPRSELPTPWRYFWSGFCDGEKTSFSNEAAIWEMQDALRLRPHLRHHGIWLPTRCLSRIHFSQLRADSRKVWNYLKIFEMEMYFWPGPASDREESGRGEGRSSSSSYSVRAPGGSGGYRSTTTMTGPSSYSSLNTDYMNRHMQDRLARPPTTSCWPSSLSQARTSTQKTYLSRAVTEVNILELFNDNDIQIQPSGSWDHSLNVS